MSSPLFPMHVHSGAPIQLSRRQRSALGEWLERGMALVASGLYTAANIHWAQAGIAQKTGVPVARWIEPQDKVRPTSFEELSADTLRLPGNRVVFRDKEGDACIILGQLRYDRPHQPSPAANRMSRHIAHNRAYSGLEEGLHTLQLVLGRYLSRAFSALPFSLKQPLLAEADIAETMLDNGCPLPLNFLSPENGYRRGELITHKPPYSVTEFPLAYEAHWPWVDVVSQQLAAMPLNTPQALGRDSTLQVNCPPGFLPDGDCATIEKLGPDEYRLSILPGKGSFARLLTQEDLGKPNSKSRLINATHAATTVRGGDWVSLNDTVLFEIPPTTGFTVLSDYDAKAQRCQPLLPHLGKLLDPDYRSKLQDNLGENLMQMAQVEQRCPQRRTNSSRNRR